MLIGCLIFGIILLVKFIRDRFIRRINEFGGSKIYTMGDIRTMTTEGVDNPEVRAHMELFWVAYDKLWIDMETISYEEFEIRSKEMWSHRNDASEIDGDYFLISLWGYSKKAREIYGDECHQTI